MIERFIESRRLFDFLVKEHTYLARELNLPEYAVRKVARRMGVPHKALSDRIVGAITQCPATITSLFAQELGASIQLVIADEPTDYTDEYCRVGFSSLEQMRSDLVRAGNRTLIQDLVAPQMGMTKSHFSQFKERVKIITLDTVVMLGEIIDVSVYAELTHDFHSAQE